MTDRASLLGSQYRDGTHLSARLMLHERYSVNPQGWLRWLFEQLDMPPGARVLEVGCGLATLWQENLERLPADWDLTLSDLSLGMIAEARRGLGATAGCFRWLVADAQALPFPNGSFDAVIANHMLYHVPDRLTAISELRRVLVAGGRLYAATNGVSHLREIRELIERATGASDYMQSRNFTLENGAAQLGQRFSNVELRRYSDALEVTEPEPLLGYVRSILNSSALTSEQLRAMRRAIEDNIEQRGSVHVGKDAGLFVAEA